MTNVNGESRLVVFLLGSSKEKNDDDEENIGVGGCKKWQIHSLGLFLFIKKIPTYIIVSSHHVACSYINGRAAVGTMA